MRTDRWALIALGFAIAVLVMPMQSPRPGELSGRPTNGLMTGP